MWRESVTPLTAHSTARSSKLQPKNVANIVFGLFPGEQPANPDSAILFPQADNLRVSAGLRRGERRCSHNMMP